MRRTAARLLLRQLCLWLAALGPLGCATVTGPPAGLPSSPADASRRQLFRVGYQGPEGSGSLRLALLETGPGAYQARATDAFGRAVWSLELAAAEATFIDHRRERFCVTEENLRIPELALGSLALERLPAVLAGRIPAVPRRPSDDPTDFVDAEGRRWTARREGSRLEAWTLWQDDRPLLWWQRRDQGGMLSHRDGAQLRWRRSLAERLDQAPPALVAPADYLAVDCADLSALPADSG